MVRITGNAALVDAIYNGTVEGDDIITMNEYLQNHCTVTHLDAELQDGTPSPCFLVDPSANGIWRNQRASMMSYTHTVRTNVHIILQVGVIVALARTLETVRQGHNGEPVPELWIHDTRGDTPFECSHLCHEGHQGCVNPVHIIIEDKDNNTHRSTRNCYRRAECTGCGIRLHSWCTHTPKCMVVHKVPCCTQCNPMSIDFQPDG